MIGYKYYHRKVRPYLEDPRKKMHTILGMTLFTLVVLGAFAIRPSLVVISELTQEVKKAQEASLLLEEKINNLSQAQINYQLHKKELKLVDRALPKEKAVPQLLGELALLAGRHNVLLHETVLGEVTSKKDNPAVKSLPLKVNISGTLPGVQGFITDFENGLRQIDFERVRIRSADTTSHASVAELELRVYFFKTTSEEAK